MIFPPLDKHKKPMKNLMAKNKTNSGSTPFESDEVASQGSTTDRLKNFYMPVVECVDSSSNDDDGRMDSAKSSDD